MRQLLTVCELLALATVLVDGYKKGPPVKEHPEICKTMTPNHDGHQSSPEAQRNLDVTTDFACYKANSLITVTIRNTSDTFFEGFFTQARKMNKDDQSYGNFMAKDGYEYNNFVQPLDCFDEKQNAFGHKGARHQTDVYFQWWAPEDLTENLELVSTIVHEKEKFWVGVKKTLTYNTNCLAPIKSRDTSAAPEVTCSSLLPVLLAAVALKLFQ